MAIGGRVEAAATDQLAHLVLDDRDGVHEDKPLIATDCGQRHLWTTTERYSPATVSITLRDARAEGAGGT